MVVGAVLTSTAGRGGDEKLLWVLAERYESTIVCLAVVDEPAIKEYLGYPATLCACFVGIKACQVKEA